MMDLSAIQYMMYARRMPILTHSGYEHQPIYICLCLMDHEIIGIADNADAALAEMISEAKRKYMPPDGNHPARLNPEIDPRS